MEKIISTLNVSELICTRISHDLIGNVGAVANAVELLEEGDMDFLDDIKSILKTSSTVLASRLKFFRMAFGSNNANLEQFPLVIKTIEDYLKTLNNGSNNIDFEFVISDAKFSKMAMIAVMIVGDTFVRGGKISVRQDGNSITILSNNNDLLKDKIFIIKEVIGGTIAENLAQYAPILYLKEILKEAGYSLEVIQGDGLNITIK